MEDTQHKLYSAYNLCISSEIDLPELLELPAEEVRQSDVTIRLAPAPADAVSNPQMADPDLRVAADALWLDVPEVGRFLVRDGTDISIEPDDRANDDVIRLFLLGSALGALLLQRRFAVLHGNAIRIGDDCLVCLGPSGIGKSTVAAAFMQRGFEILSDDVVPIDSDCCAVPGFPRLKLWQDAADRLSISTQPLNRVGFNLNKFNLPTPPVDRSRGNLPIRWVYVLNANPDVDKVSVERLSGTSRLMALIENAYRPNFLKGMSLEGLHLQRCLQLVRRAQISRVSRPTSSFIIEDLINTLLEDASEKP